MSKRSKAIRAAKKAKRAAAEKAREWAAICAASWNGELMVCSHGGIAIEHPHAYGYDGTGHGWLYVDLNEHMNFGGARHDYAEIVNRRLATVLDPGKATGPTIIDLYDRGLDYETLRSVGRSEAPALAPCVWSAFPEQRRVDPAWYDADPSHTYASLADFASANLGVIVSERDDSPLDFCREANALACEAHRAA